MALNSRALRNLLAAMEAEEAAEKASNGTTSSFNNYGNGNQSHTDTKINSGAYSGDGNSHHTYNKHGGSDINNSGTFNGHGNGGFIGGNFDASSRNYRI
uniref:Cold-induced PsAD2-like protein n=1 Tax=Ammopiptanthus mongolicus TaxID=126911 RepID=A0EVX2_AMMMO|nr:cold-induced PsAD2-like protein [Ammopiptanthus mongolicus]